MKPIDTSVRVKWVSPAFSKLPTAAAQEGTREAMMDGAFTPS